MPSQGMDLLCDLDCIEVARRVNLWEGSMKIYLSVWMEPCVSVSRELAINTLNASGVVT